MNPKKLVAVYPNPTPREVAQLWRFKTRWGGGGTHGNRDLLAENGDFPALLIRPDAILSVPEICSLSTGLRFSHEITKTSSLLFGSNLEMKNL